MANYFFGTPNVEKLFSFWPEPFRDSTHRLPTFRQPERREVVTGTRRFHILRPKIYNRPSEI
jgi:hypothetical protein